MKHLLKKMAAVANELDINGFEKEANEVTMSMLKMAQGIIPIRPTPNPRSEFNQQNQPLGIQMTDAVADNTGTNAIGAGGANVFAGLARAYDGLMTAVTGSGQVAIGTLMAYFGYLTLPVEAVAEVVAQLGHSNTDPLLTTIETQNNQITALVKALLDAQKKGDKELAAKIQSQIGAAAKEGKSIAMQLSNMLEKRKAIPGQYKLDATEFQKTLNYAVANKLTVREMYDRAVRNRGGDESAKNYANNLIAKYRNIHGDASDTAPVVPTKLN